MTIELMADHFTNPDQAIAEICGNGLLVFEMELGPDKLTGRTHAHSYHVDIYLVEGLLDVHDAASGVTHRLEAGSRAVIPAGVVHSEASSGDCRIVFGLSEDPRRSSMP